MAGSCTVSISPSRLEDAVFGGKCPSCGKVVMFTLPREVYRFEETTPLGVCPSCEHGFAVVVVDALPANLGPGAEGGIGADCLMEVEQRAKLTGGRFL